MQIPPHWRRQGRAMRVIKLTSTLNLLSECLRQTKAGRIGIHRAGRGSVWGKDKPGAKKTGLTRKGAHYAQWSSHGKMYVSYLLEKDAGMYPNSVRHPSLNLNHQNFVPAPPQYSDFTGYHHVPGINNDPHHSQSGAWNPAYTPREEWTPYGPGTGPSTSNPAQIGFAPPEFSPVQPPPGLLPSSINTTVGQLSPNSQRRNPYDWMRRSAPPTTSGGKTRTKDKYRVVYTDHQRLELEKEFHYSRYITIRRKAELATALSLSERQVKIWFQNRRAKERKVNKKKMQQPQPASTTTPTPPGSAIPANVAMVSSSSGGLVSPSMQMTIKEEY